MMTPSEKAQLERLEQKVDRLLSLLMPAAVGQDMGQVAAFASGGIEGLKAFQKAKVAAERRMTHA